jgi:hypothetical protein
MLPGKAGGITIGPGENGDKYQTLDLILYRSVNITGFMESVVQIFVKIKRNLFLKCGIQLLL